MPGVTRSAEIRGLEPKELYDVIVDYESYPRYFKDFTRCRVLERDGDVATVEFTAKVVKEVSYTLRIVHDPGALTTRWTFVRGTLVTDSRGGWALTPIDDGAKVVYDAEIEVNAPLPGFILKKIQDAILNRSIATMFEQLEQEARSRRG